MWALPVDVTEHSESAGVQGDWHGPWADTMEHVGKLVEAVVGWACATLNRQELLECMGSLGSHIL